MPRCFVARCSNIATHKLPEDIVLRNKWLRAIRKYAPISSYTRICRSHFLESDYLERNAFGMIPAHKHLKKDAVPSQFSWTKKPSDKQHIRRPVELQEFCDDKVQDICISEDPDEEQEQEMDVSHEIEYAQDDNETSEEPCIVTMHDIPEIPEIPEIGSETIEVETTNRTENYNNCKSTQTPVLLGLSFDLFSDNESIKFYTGLETYEKFQLVLSTLLPMAHDLKYRNTVNLSLSVEDKFLMLLMKLRRNKTDYELAQMFKISKSLVSNIVVTWINFVHDVWRLIDIWPSRELIKFYMPDTFHINNPTTRVIVDGTEIPIQKPRHPNSQKATFSAYKHKNTMKILIGSSPGGLITYSSKAYAGSTSDRQIVERSDLMNLCEPGDSIMADRGFNVQDIFANKNIAINIPSFLKGKSQLPENICKTDQKLASSRVHIERIIGLTKTYLILKNELNHNYVPLTSKIFFICAMLTNFRECIMSKTSK